jgi:hypothetical protein
MFGKTSTASHSAANFATDSAVPGMPSYLINKIQLAKTILK